MARGFDEQCARRRPTGHRSRQLSSEERGEERRHERVEERGEMTRERREGGGQSGHRSEWRAAPFVSATPVSSRWLAHSDMRGQLPGRCECATKERNRGGMRDGEPYLFSSVHPDRCPQVWLLPGRGGLLDARAQWRAGPRPNAGAAVLLHPPLTSVGVSIVQERGCQHSYRHAPPPGRRPDQHQVPQHTTLLKLPLLIHLSTIRFQRGVLVERLNHPQAPQINMPACWVCCVSAV